MDTLLSTDLLDAIDGGEECRGRDAQISEWARTAEKYERALERLTNGYKYPTEVVTIAREALSMSAAEAERRATQP